MPRTPFNDMVFIYRYQCPQTRCITSLFLVSLFPFVSLAWGIRLSSIETFLILGTRVLETNSKETRSKIFCSALDSLKYHLTSHRYDLIFHQSVAGQRIIQQSKATLRFNPVLSMKENYKRSSYSLCAYCAGAPRAPCLCISNRASLMKRRRFVMYPYLEHSD